MKEQYCADSFRAKTLAVLVFLLVAATCWSQEVRATLGGRVTDATGAFVPNASVEVISDDTGVVQHTVANGEGYWAVRFLLPGSYHFTITAAGFKKAMREGMTLQAGDSKSIDVQLQIGAVADSVEVTAEVPLIDTTSATSGAVITGQEIVSMPSMSRVPITLAMLSPGVVYQPQNNSPLHPWAVGGASQIYAAGVGSVYSNGFQLDGMPDVGASGQVSFIPSPDSLQEFRVLTNAYDAQISRVGTLSVNMQTKSGGKGYHGSLYEFNQNNILNALQYGTLSSQKPPVHLNQYGGTFGGPVRIPKLYNGKDRTFFFFNYEGLRNSNAQPVIASVPTELERQGDFSKSYTVDANKNPFPINIYDPATVNMTTGVRQQFAGNVIPKSRLDPIAQNILKYIPLPNMPADTASGNAVRNYQSAGVRADKLAEISLRLDHQWSDTQRSYAVYHWMRNTEYSQNTFGTVATGVLQPRSPIAVGLDHLWTISSNKVLDLSFSVNRFENSDINTGIYTHFDQASLGFPTSFTSKLLGPGFPYITGLPTGSIGTNLNSIKYNTYSTWKAGMTHMLGKHNLKYGGEFWVLQEADGNTGAQPSFSFGSEWTRPSASVGGGTGQGSTLASFLLGLPDGGSEANNASAFYSQHFTGFYFQDDWRTTSRLTFNLGLRWDYERPVLERFNRMISTYDPTAVSPINAQVQAAYAANATNPANANNKALQTLLQNVPVSSFQVLGAQLFNGVNGQPRTVSNTDYTQFQPRVGFAYQITPSFVVRGGAGRFVRSKWSTGSQTGFSQSTPFTATSNQWLTPVDTLSNPFQAGFLQPAGASLGAMSNLGNSPTWINPDAKRTYAWNSNLELQKQYKNWLFEASFVHMIGRDLAMNEDMNLPSFDLWKQLLTPTFDATGRPIDILPWNQQVPNPFYGIKGVQGSMGTSKTVSLGTLLRPIPIASVSLTDNPIGSTQYDALQVKVEHRFSKGFSVLNAFTWSKSFEDDSYWGPEIAGRVLEHKLNSQDRPFVLSIAPVWDLPVGRKRALGGNMPKVLDFIAGGWGLSGNYQFQSGSPLDFGTQSFYNGQAFGLSGDKQSLNNWFDTSAFMPFPGKSTCLQGNPYCDPKYIMNYPAWTGIQNLPGFNYYGTPADYDATGKCKGVCNGVYQDFATVYRTHPSRFADVRNPHTNELNLALLKNFQATEKVKVQFRFEAFNVFNTIRWPSPDTNPASSTFGKINNKTQENTARQIQMALKLNF